MSALAEFLERLLIDGEVAFEGPLRPAKEERPAALAVLRQAYRTYCLGLAGPALPLREETALAAAELVRRACWFLVDHRDAPEVVEQALTLPPPRQPAEHAAADLTLRFTPQLLRRARLTAADDPLAVRLAELLRHWPLSGVLADVEDGPFTPVDFGGHAGLLLLYAERLAGNLKPAWVPDGPAFEVVELVFREAGRPAPRPWVSQGEPAHE